MEKLECEVLVIGAGPAGLAAANILSYNGVNFLLVDLGKNIERRNHKKPEEVVAGLGGAGLFCDGKISYYPSSHALYSLPNDYLVKKAYSWFHALSSDIIENPPAFPFNCERELYESEGNTERFFEKKYNTFYLNTDQLSIILKRLTVPIQHRICLETEVKSIKKSGELYIVTVLNRGNNVVCEIETHSVIFCGGRFGPIVLKSIYPDLPTIFRRLEYGLRIEQKKNCFFGNAFSTIDTKLIMDCSNNVYQWRTFCCCRDGKVLETKFGDIRSYSGMRAKSAFSNVGFNVRIKNSGFYDSHIDEINLLIAGKIKPFSMALTDFIDSN